MPKDVGKNYIIRKKRIPFSDVKRMVKEIRDKREKDKNEKLKLVEEKYQKKMKFIEKTHEKLR